MLKQTELDFNVNFANSWFIDYTLIDIQMEIIIMGYITITMNKEDQKKLIRDHVNREIKVNKRLNIDEIHVAAQAVW